MDLSKWFRVEATTSNIPSGITNTRSSESEDRLQLEEQRDRLFGTTSMPPRGKNPPRQMMNNNNNNNDINNNDRKEDNGGGEDTADSHQEVNIQVENDGQAATAQTAEGPPTEAPTTPVAEQGATSSPTKDATDEPTEEVTREPATTEAPRDQQQPTPNSNNVDNTAGKEEEDTAVEVETRIDLVKLVPFDVKLALVSPVDLNSFALTDIVTDWMDESLAAEVKRMELGLTHSAFDSVILEERAVQQRGNPVTFANHNNNRQRQLRRHLQQEEVPTAMTIASYEGVTLWKHVTPSNLQVMTPALLEDIERQALLQDNRLLELLQASPAQGLGSSVMDVRAYINPNPTFAATSTNSASNNNNGNTSTTNANLELIIVVAIVVACMAFAFLVFSLFWAWRFDQQRRDAAYRVDAPATATSPTSATHKGGKKRVRSPDGTGGTSNSEDGSSRMTPANMNVMMVNSNADDDDDTALGYPASENNATTSAYPESVVSEDISTSLSAYYRSGMGTRPIYNPKALGANDFNDAASFSSMESYGYSLDGYAPSLGGNTYANNTKATVPSKEDDDDEDENL